MAGRALRARWLKLACFTGNLWLKLGTKGAGLQAAAEVSLLHWQLLVLIPEQRDFGLQAAAGGWTALLMVSISKPNVPHSVLRIKPFYLKNLSVAATKTFAEITDKSLRIINLIGILQT